MDVERAGQGLNSVFLKSLRRNPYAMNIRATIQSGLTMIGPVIAIAAMGVSVATAQVEDGDARNEQIWLTAHNVERDEFGVAPLVWNAQLARDARLWANQLATENRLRHASVQERGGRGENLWMGTAGYFSADQMIGHFADEKQFFRPGQFPSVSTTGNWADVGHYTQIVWADTREVGCAKVQNARFDVLVCRYWPAGNILGVPIVPARNR
ncbi:MAG: CAP domain-containing protein [Erythrobacter sp.]